MGENWVGYKKKGSKKRIEVKVAIVDQLGAIIKGNLPVTQNWWDQLGSTMEIY